MRRNILWVVMAVLVVDIAGYVYWDQATNNKKLRMLQQKLDAALEKTNRDRRNTEAAKVASKAIIQAAPAKQISNGITIQYFAKQTDLESNKDLVPSWRRLGFNVDQKGAQYELPSNKIWYGSKVDLQSVQTVAYTLLENGIALRIIEPLSKSGLDQGRERVIQVGWSGMAANLPLLTPDDIKRFEFPKQNAFNKEQSTAPLSSRQIINSSSSRSSAQDRQRRPRLE